ncbi:MAG: phosphoribosylpyrophosphate synthetase [Flavobacteriales bacterium]|nr:phosphoribosylpyrophosphate synthetase [Flavobacteriales bacterium]MCB0757580.1 phosphoribosylpyrophosphate synthetase [Flavobacteriales bacterium]
MQNVMPPLSEILNRLKAKGYTEDFNLKADGIDRSQGDQRLSPADFNIDEYFRFEGSSDPGDGAIVYAISSEKYGIKGVMVNAYGVYADPLTDEMLEKLRA